MAKNFAGGDLYPSINVNDDSLMVSLRLRQPRQQVYDFSKSKEERLELNKVKSSKKGPNKSFYKKEEKQGKLTVYLKNPGGLNSNKFRTTVPIICTESEIISILANFKRDKLEVTKHYFKSK